MATGERRWHIVGAYVAPEGEVTMETVIAAIGIKPLGEDLMVEGDFNVDILAPEGRRAENIASRPGNGGSRRYGAAFHAAKETVVSGLTDVGHEATGTGGAVPD